ncbi:LPXTG cell wall anchor domain-containing protein [Enterococcus avium]
MKKGNPFYLIFGSIILSISIFLLLKKY